MVASASAIAVKALAIARQQIGKPYVWGAVGPNGFDCSGLIWYAYQHAGHPWPRYNDAGQAAHGQRISQANLLPGDLVRPHVGHIQMYSGRGNIVEAPSTGHPVRERSMWGFYDGTRIVAATGGAASPTGHGYPGILHLGMTGTGVRQLQQRLKDRGYVINVDADFGPATYSVVRRFQVYKHITSDGIVGSITWSALWV